jgi:hypothetical protein
MGAYEISVNFVQFEPLSPDLFQGYATSRYIAMLLARTEVNISSIMNLFL